MVSLSSVGKQILLMVHSFFLTRHHYWKLGNFFICVWCLHVTITDKLIATSRLNLQIKLCYAQLTQNLLKVAMYDISNSFQQSLATYCKVFVSCKRLLPNIYFSPTDTHLKSKMCKFKIHCGFWSGVIDMFEAWLKNLLEEKTEKQLMHRELKLWPCWLCRASIHSWGRT